VFLDSKREDERGSGLNCSKHVRWVPCHHGMARPQIADGGNGFEIWRVAANILNKQSRTADKGWSSCLGVECFLTTPHRKTFSCYDHSQEASDGRYPKLKIYISETNCHTSIRFMSERKTLKDVFMTDYAHASDGDFRRAQ
jgi:hypothetical protein